jgi:hypothetical protein
MRSNTTARLLARWLRLGCLGGLTLVAITAPAMAATDAGSGITLGGGVGLVRMGTADAGRPGFLRLGLGTEFFSAESFLLATAQGASDQHRRLGATLSLGVTPLRFWEIYGSLAAASNRNRRLCDGSAGCQADSARSDPEILRTFGDLALGTKVAAPVGRGASLGGRLQLELPSAVTGMTFSPEASRLSVDLLASWDPATGLTAAAGGALPRAHLSAGFMFDRSAERIDLPSLAAASQVVSAFAYGVAGNRLRTALGLDWRSPLLPGGVVLRPMAEYHLEVIVEQADADATAALGAQASSGGRDQQWLTGALALETRGWSVVAGLDAPLRSAGLRYGPRLPPWNLLLSVGYGLFAGRPEVVTRTVTVEKPVPPPAREGQAVGVVRGADGAAIAGATVEVLGLSRARVISDADGGFRTPLLAAGERQLEISAPGFRPRRLAVTIVAGQEVEGPVTLEPQGAAVEAQLRDRYGAPVAGRIRLQEQAAGADAPLTSGATVDVAAETRSRFQMFLPPGRHHLLAEAEGFLAQAVSVQIADGAPVPLAIELRPRPPAPGVLIRDGLLSLAGPVAFDDDDVDDHHQATAAPALALTPATQGLLDEVADLLLTRAPEAPRLRVEVLVKVAAGNRAGGGDLQALRLGERRAAAVAAYLTSRGVPERRLVAVGLASGRQAAGKQRTASAVALRILD